MGLYDKINSTNAPLQRKLFDFHVMQNGRSMSVTRIGYDNDVWGNGGPTLQTTDNIEAIISFPPGELPLNRFRAAGDDSPESTSLFFYDILPIEAFFAFRQKMEEGDVIYFFIEDEMGNKIPIIFKILSLVGAVTTHLIRKKYICAPLTSLSEVTTEIADLIRTKLTNVEEPAPVVPGGEEP